MELLGMSLLAHTRAPAPPIGGGSVGDAAAGGPALQGLEWGARVHLTPPPEQLVRAEVAEAAMLRARGVADHMGLQVGGWGVEMSVGGSWGAVLGL